MARSSICGKMSKMKFIMDVDTGCDDADAIMLALSGLVNVEVVAITCAVGNTSAKQAAVNTLRVLQECHRLDIPVFVGASSPLLQSADCGARCSYYGSDGFSSDKNQEAVDVSLLQKEPAAVAMTKLAAASPGEITLLALAPLTNVALAIKLDPNFAKNLKNFVVMGGSLSGQGNCSRLKSRLADFNFGTDPEAAQIVLSQMNIGADRFHILPLETCQRSTIEWEWCDDVLMSIDTARGRFHRNIWASVLPQKRASGFSFYSCDFFAAVVAMLDGAAIDGAVSHLLDGATCRSTDDALNRSADGSACSSSSSTNGSVCRVVKGAVKRHCAVETNGTLTRGLLVVGVKFFSEDSEPEAPTNVTLITDLNFAVIKSYMLAMLQDR